MSTTDIATATGVVEVRGTITPTPSNTFVMDAVNQDIVLSRDSANKALLTSDGTTDASADLGTATIRVREVFAKILSGAQPVATASGDGVITITPGVVKITKGSAAALTLADPAAGNEGTILVILATTAFAHTVDNSAGSGFNGGGGTKDVATFSTVVANNLVLVALGSKWYIIVSTGVTLG